MVSPVTAQTDTAIDLAYEIRNVVDPLVTRQTRISDRLQSDESALDDRLLERYREELKQLSIDSLKVLDPYRNDIFALHARLRNLSDSADSESAPAEIRLERDALLQQQAKITLAIKDAELVSVRSRDLADDILVQIRTRFLGTLFERREATSIMFTHALSDFPIVFSRLSRALSSWVDYISNTHLFIFLLIFLVSLILSFFFVVLFQRFHRLARGVDGTSPRIMSSFFSTVIPGTSFAIIMLVFHFGLLYFDLYRFSMESFVAGLLLAITGLVFASLLLNSILSPFTPSARLLPMSDGAAKSLSLIYLLMVFIFALDSLTARVLTLFADTIESVIVKNILTTLLISFLLVLSLCVRVRPSPSPKWPTPLFWLIVFLIFTMLLSLSLGYGAFGRFVSGQIILTGSVLSLAYLGFLSSAALSDSGAFATTSLGNRLVSSSSFSQMRMDQLGLILSILIRIFLVLVTLPILALQWGYSLSQITEWLLTGLTGFSIGGLEFSFGRILIAIFIFVTLIFFTKMVQRWVVTRVFSRTRLDSGIKNSLRSGLGYIGYFLAGLIGLSATGIQLSNIALVAGALSVGIGFGLQNIVNNFVSGLIMLIERPIKVGDIISVAGTEGYVRKINVRATELETFDRQSVIIPNSDLINTAVGNWMHQDVHRRVIVNIGVAYGSDVERVREILLSVADEHPLIISNIDTFVYFKAFGESSLDFELRVIIKDINDTLIVENDLRFAIVSAFKEHGIEIPFPRRDLYIKSGEKSGIE